MEPPNFGAANRSSSPLCEGWRPGSEDAVFHLAHMVLFLGLLGGGGLPGLLYLYSCLALGFSCAAVRAWREPCSADGFRWSLALGVLCAAQLLLVGRRLRSVSWEPDFRELYNRMFKKLGVSLTHFARIVACSDGEVRRLQPLHRFAEEGRTPIDKLSVLLTGRVRVTVNGEFLHHILPFQFLDSPEWDSLRPSEEGVFQVTLTAEVACRYVSWRRKKLYLLFAKHRYIAKIFALLVRNDIADKLYSLSDAPTDGRRHDLRLPSYPHADTAHANAS